jgi:hypothetical protein
MGPAPLRTLYAEPVPLFSDGVIPRGRGPAVWAVDAARAAAPFRTARTGAAQSRARRDQRRDHARPGRRHDCGGALQRYARAQARLFDATPDDALREIIELKEDGVIDPDPISGLIGRLRPLSYLEEAQPEGIDASLLKVEPIALPAEPFSAVARLQIAGLDAGYQTSRRRIMPPDWSVETPEIRLRMPTRPEGARSQANPALAALTRKWNLWFLLQSGLGVDVNWSLPPPLSFVVIVPLPLLWYRPIGNIDLWARFASRAVDQCAV